MISELNFNRELAILRKKRDLVYFSCFLIVIGKTDFLLNKLNNKNM